MWFSRGKYVVSRVLHGIPIILAIVVVNFFLIRMAPGDAAQVLAGEAGAETEQYVRQIREQFGLDQPLWFQFVSYMKNLLTFDLGFSFRHGRSIGSLIAERLGASLLLMVSTIVLSIALGVTLGAIAAMRDRTWLSHAIVAAAIIIYATPLFWIGLMLIIVFSLNLGWFPTSGMVTIGVPRSGFAHVLDIAHHLVLPTIALSGFYMALYARLMRASMLETLGQDYIKTARAKGLGERKIVMRHALRNAVIPVLTMAGVQVSAMFGGSVIVESVFGWPGLGLLAYEALASRDMNLLLGILFLSSILVVLTNAVVDVVYTIVDPRIRLS